MTITHKRKGPAPGTIYARIKRPPLGEKILALRRECGLSQTDLAKKTGLTKRTISFYERESENIPVPKLELIAKALGVTIDTMLGYKADPTTLQANRSFLKKLDKAKRLSSDKQKVIADLINTLSAPPRKETNRV